MTNSDSQNNRPVRSYVVRSGRLTDSQRKAIDKHWQDHVLNFTGAALDLSAAFSRTAPLTLEIGFGMGASMVAMAESEPNTNFLGIEVHRPGLGKVLQEISTRKLENLKLLCHDAKEVVELGIAPGSLQRILVLFPDPWPKKRHHKRRLIQSEFVELLASRLTAQGTLHLATDWQAYAEHMLEVLEASPTLINANGAGAYWEKPSRPGTKFEARGRRLGHGVWDLLYKKVES